MVRNRWADLRVVAVDGLEDDAYDVDDESRRVICWCRSRSESCNRYSIKHNRQSSTLSLKHRNRSRSRKTCWTAGDCAVGAGCVEGGGIDNLRLS